MTWYFAVHNGTFNSREVRKRLGLCYLWMLEGKLEPEGEICRLILG